MYRAEMESLSITGYFYVRQDMEGRAFWFHVMQLLNGRYQRELSENHVTAQRASCQTAFKRAVIETNGARRESYRRLCGWLMELMTDSVLVRIRVAFSLFFIASHCSAYKIYAVMLNRARRK